MLQATAKVAGEQVVEATSANLVLDRLAGAIRRRPEETTLTDRRWHALMFEERARHSLESLARRMRAASTASGDSFEAFNALGEHVQFVAKAHLERLVLQAFIDGIEACADVEARGVLEDVCSLYALSSIHDQRAWYLEHNRIRLLEVEGDRPATRRSVPQAQAPRTRAGGGHGDPRTLVGGGDPQGLTDGQKVAGLPGVILVCARRRACPCSLVERPRHVPSQPCPHPPRVGGPRHW
ncbi:acyl-CoA dehydrogenase [Demequina litorisediminis]|uniref:Acyl-CoA oxidase C-terminal domain-containing protein n=1 Tax=Demequina litorisediminis TaxID=1849022 RepID=A0ABQ6ILD3_9MICO|nr:acyl-CoA dehydrogenase [Demequina litorisediminis]GMA37537.1 hypothetical protein GCM10025876_37410 [Demequina litorisediminis]